MTCDESCIYYLSSVQRDFSNFASFENCVMNCGDIEINPGVLDQCYSNNSFVTTAVLGVINCC